MAFDTQINVLSVDTENFYSNNEARLHRVNNKIRFEKQELRNRQIEIEKQLKQYNIDVDTIDDLDSLDYDDNSIGLIKQYYANKNFISYKTKKIKELKDRLLLLLSNKMKANIDSKGNHHIRILREDTISDSNIISVFESSFTRMINANKDKLCEDFMVVQVYFFSVIQDCIYYGFEYKGEKYRYFTSSAGQIRNKKCVFVKDSIWNKYEKTIMCGLTLDKINAMGGCNQNKYLAYAALINSATDIWNEFDIDKTIVIDDFETDVDGTYDLINDDDYTITRTNGKVPIPHTDGCGIMLPKMGKNRMIRLPWIKGLLGQFDFVKFINTNNYSPIIEDIYGVEHDVIKEGIEIIFTKSQFKLYKYYKSWEEYKEYFKKYNCSAGYTNIEEDRIKNATINYQMLQTFTDITKDEMNDIAKSSIHILENICSNIQNMQNVFGANVYNTNMTALQKAILLYPNLMNDTFFKNQIREIKNSLVKKYKAGKLNVNGKYTFVLPDLYACCEHWFGHIKNPKGLLKDKEVFCWLFRRSEKVDCLRSPHLYKEHALRKNLAYNNYDKQEELREWFCTDAIYTSSHDLISKLLQFDVDGDKLLVVSDKCIIDVAERNMKDIVPLYYNMKKANPSILTNETIYKGLMDAFTGGNIGIYSNNISKIWNSDVFQNGTDEEKRLATDYVKLLCMENNFVIDFAKTLYKPIRPDDIDDKINDYIKNKLPHFFIYAKDKEEHQVELSNKSFINELDGIIKNPRINCRGLKIDKIDYKLLMNNPDIEFQVAFNDNNTINKDNTDKMLLRFIELNNEYKYKINYDVLSDVNHDALKYSDIRHSIVYKNISNTIKTELLSFGYSENEVVDILVKYLYHIKPSPHKNVLWFCFGDIIYENMCNHIKINIKDVECVKCGKWITAPIKDTRTTMCRECYSEHRKYRKKCCRKH